MHTTIGKYRILEEIGSGGMGVVYRALDGDLGRVVAIKMLQPRSGSAIDRERFLREARTAAKLRHPGIVAIHEIGTTEDRPYLVMDYIAGFTLADLIAAGRRREPDAAAPAAAPGKEAPAEAAASAQASSAVAHDDLPTRAAPESADGAQAAPAPPAVRLVEVAAEVPRLTQRVALEILREVALALDHAHSHGIIHRDIKPSNILVDQATRRPFLTDFGLAREVLNPERITLSGTILGTPQYMAPEIASGSESDPTSAVDLYGLGAVLYELLVDRPPHDGRSAVEVVYKVIHADPPAPTKVNPRIHRDLETIVLRCLEKDPRRRYDAARDLADELGRFLAGEPILARPVGRLERAARRMWRHKALTAAVGLALLGLVGTLGAWAQDAVQRRREARASFTEGLRRLDAGEADEAVRHLADAAALVRGDAEIERWLATARRRQAELRQAELDRARELGLAEQAARRDRALPHFLKGEELRAKAGVLVRHGDLDARQAYLENAVEAYARSLEQDPAFAEAFTGRGRVHVELGDVRQAHENFRRAVELRPEFTEAYLGRLQLLTEEYEALWMRSGRVSSADIGTMSSLPDLAGDPEAEAIARRIDDDIRTVLRLGVRPEEAKYFEGWLLRNAGDRDGARKAFDESITLWKYFAPAYEGRACIRLLQRDPDLDGIGRDLDEGVRLDPGFYRVRFLRFYLMLQKKEHLRALAEVNELIRLRPRLASIHLARGYIRRRFLNDIPGAFADFRAAMKHDPECLLAYVNVAILLNATGKTDEAIREFNRALLINDRYALAYYHRASVLRQAKRPDEALLDLERAIALDEAFGPAYVERARMLVERKRLDEALLDLAKARALDPRDADAVHLTANVLYALGREEDALPLYDRAIEMEGDEPMYHFNRALVHLRGGRFAEAAVGFEKVLAMSPPSALRQSAERRLAEARGKMAGNGGK